MDKNCWRHFNPFPDNDTFWSPWETSLLKTLREKEKKWAISLLLTMFSNSLENFLLFTSNSKLLSADCFNLDQSKILSSGNGLKCIWNEKKVHYRVKNIVFHNYISFVHQNVALCGKWLTHFQTTNFRLFQIERLCRRQFKTWRKWQKVIQTGGKHCGKRRNCLLRAISPFPTVFSKGLFHRGVKRCHCVGMG